MVGVSGSEGMRAGVATASALSRPSRTRGRTSGVVLKVKSVSPAKRPGMDCALAR